MDKENQNCKKLIEELTNKMNVEKMNNMELNSNLKSLGEELNIKTVALDAAKSDSLKLAGSLTNVKCTNKNLFLNSFY